VSLEKAFMSLLPAKLELITAGQILAGSVSLVLSLVTALLLGLLISSHDGAGLVRVKT
jgi:hypothetical protein